MSRESIILRTAASTGTDAETAQKHAFSSPKRSILFVGNHSQNLRHLCCSDPRVKVEEREGNMFHRNYRSFHHHPGNAFLFSEDLRSPNLEKCSGKDSSMMVSAPNATDVILFLEEDAQNWFIFVEKI